jgi:phenylalanyl-tRNA synthetase alpha chain
MRRDVNEIIAKLHPLERKVLPALQKATSLHEIVSVSGLQEVEVMRALQWLQNKGVLQLKQKIQELVEIDIHGKEYIEKGMPEKRFLKALKESNGLTFAQIQENAGISQQEVQVCIGLLKRQDAIDMKKDGDLVVSLTDKGKEIMGHQTDEEKLLKSLEFPRETASLTDQENKAMEVLLQRPKLVKVTVLKLRSITLTAVGKELVHGDLGAAFAERLTQDMLKDGSWKDKKFRHYDVTINVPEVAGGKRHIVSQANQYIKKIWLDMGFVEMTGNMLHTSYWDLDALFVPQDHPARQMQDTFYIKDETGKDIAQGKIPVNHKAVKEMHEHGGETGSAGWGTAWHKKEAEKVLLRTHTTVLSAQKLAELGKDKDLMKKLPMKFFALGKVFRNEALDWKHLFEFYQVDGIVIDPDANLRNLKAYLRQFFGKMGFPKVRMRPAYFPYTEPSLEVEVWHPKKQQWVELGGAGIFRPEVVVPLLGVDIPVLAWGLGPGRIIGEYWKLTDIRDLYRNDMKQSQDFRMWVR